jgi:predicted ATP-dependent serine protease
MTLAVVPTDTDPADTDGPSLRLVDRSTPAEPTRWIVDGMVAREAVTMFAGIAGGGKSLLAMQLAAIASSRFRVAIVDAENGTTVIKQRLAKLPPALQVYEPERFDLESGLAQLEAIAAQGLDLLVLDSWVSLWTGSENSVRSVKRCLEGLRALARKYNLGILLIHHTTKGTNTYRGSGAIAGAIEAVFVLERESDTRRVLVCQKMRLGPEPKPVTLELAGGGFRVAVPTEVIASESPIPSLPAPQTTVVHGAAQWTRRDVLEALKLGTIGKRRAERMLGLRVRWWRGWA